MLIYLTKLDAYDYTINPGIINIKLDGLNDPDIVDIMSEISRSEGRIYVEGRYMNYSDYYRLFSNSDHAILELHVSEY